MLSPDIFSGIPVAMHRIIITKTRSYVLDNLGDSKFEDKDSIVYDGKVKKPGIIVKNGDVVLTQGRDYTVSYRNNINAPT